jgi:hypothetical protein
MSDLLEKCRFLSLKEVTLSGPRTPSSLLQDAEPNLKDREQIASYLLHLPRGPIIEPHGYP